MKQPHPSMRTTSARRGLVAGGVFLLLILGLVIGATVAAAVSDPKDSSEYLSLVQDAKDTQTRLELSEGELNGAQEHVTASQDDLTAAKNELDATKDKLTAAKNELDATKDTLSSTEADLEDMIAEMPDRGEGRRGGKSPGTDTRKTR
jgi:peptidoglycan hydrolase CwlO-like protein